MPCVPTHIHQASCGLPTQRTKRLVRVGVTNRNVSLASGGNGIWNRGLIYPAECLQEFQNACPQIECLHADMFHSVFQSGQDTWLSAKSMMRISSRIRIPSGGVRPSCLRGRNGSALSGGFLQVSLYLRGDFGVNPFAGCPVKLA